MSPDGSNDIGTMRLLPEHERSSVITAKASKINVPRQQLLEPDPHLALTLGYVAYMRDMIMAINHTQLQRQLYLLGYPQPLPNGATVLVSMLLKDMQAALDRVKELEAQSTQLEREDRTNRATMSKLKTEIHSLRMENNTLRSEVLNCTRELDQVRREQRTQVYEMEKKVDDLRMAQLRMKAECAESQRLFSECQKKLAESVAVADPRGRIARITMSEPLKLSLNHIESFEKKSTVDLVDLSSRRIHALEDEVSYLETKLETMESELRAAQLEVKERDLELMRLNNELEQQVPTAADIPGSRLTDQVNYLHECAEQLERENKEIHEQFTREKDELHKRWVQTENERAQLADNNNNYKQEASGGFERIREIVQRLKNSYPGTRSLADELQNELQRLPHNSSNSLSNNTDDGEMERLRTEHANIKSLYAQTRDQLQELLKAGNADLHYVREQSRESENKLRTDMEQSVAEMNANVEELQSEVDVKDARIKDLEQQLKRRQKALDDSDRQHGEERERLQKRIGKLAEFEVIAQQHDSTLRECQRLVEQHNKVDQSLREALREVSESRSKISRLDHRVSGLTRHLSDHKMLNKQNTSELKSCRRALDAYKRDMETMQQARETAKRDTERLRAELSQLVRLRDAMEMAKDEYKAQLAKSLKENEAHRGLAAHLMAERDALRVQVKAQFHLNQRLEQRLQAVERRDSPSMRISDSTIFNELPSLLADSGRRISGSSSAHSSRSFAQSDPNST
ncbi:hypothetical protein GGI26_005783 [Coemansia sp. RSA 1358]|nr:hypothetical protein EDC05_005514 [Coemansia umbellata]KAJ2619511.1 hypothetical protein GGI26_005783 [Coemansia sp. RSA 1358]